MNKGAGVHSGVVRTTAVAQVRNISGLGYGGGSGEKLKIQCMLDVGPSLRNQGWSEHLS